MDERSRLLTLFAHLTNLVLEEAAILRLIVEEGHVDRQQASGAGYFADRLAEFGVQMTADAKEASSAELAQKARYWGLTLGSIYRVVNARYPESEHHADKDAVEAAIYETALSLYRLTR